MDWIQPKFDLDLAKRLAQSALHAYDTIDEIKARGATPIYRPRFDLQAVVENCPDCTILSLRGTRSVKNWKIDANAIPNARGIHTGFEEAYQDLEQPIFDAMPHDHSKPIFITGHSLGGALACRCAAEHIHPDAVYTFNQPRVFTRHYIRTEPDLIACLNLWRVVDREDLVSHIPGLIAGYRHIGGLALITDQDKISINPPSLNQIWGHTKGVSADLFRIFHGELPQWVLIKDHSMDLCVEELHNVSANPETPAAMIQPSQSTPRD